MMVYDIAAAGGRVYILSAPEGDVMPPDAEWVIIKDPENDGIMNVFEAFSSTAWVASPYGDRLAWEPLIYADGFQLDLN